MEQSILLNSSSFVPTDKGTYIIRANDLFELYILRNHKSVVGEGMSSTLKLVYSDRFVPNKGAAEYNMFNATINRIRKQIFSTETEEYTEDSILKTIIANIV